MVEERRTCVEAVCEDVRREDLKRCRKMVEGKRGEVGVLPPRKCVKREGERAIVCRACFVNAGKIEVVAVLLVERALRPVSQRIAYLTEGRKLKKEEVATASFHSATCLRVDEEVLLLAYLRRRASRVRMEDIPLAINVAWRLPYC